MLMIDLISIIAVLTVSAVASSACQVSLTESASMPTLGNAGFEHFVLDQKHYVATANFWDGCASDMSAQSTLHELRHSATDELSLTPVQRFDTRGAHGWDFFNHSTHQFLVVPNYYWCPQHKAVCEATAIYVNSGTAQKPFQLFQSLVSHGPGQTDHFCLPTELTKTTLPQCYLLVAENFANLVSIWQFVPDTPAKNRQRSDSGLSGSFVKTQVLSVAGAGSMAVQIIGRSVILVVAAYHDNGWRTQSMAFRWSLPADTQKIWKPEFTELQRFETHGAHDAEMIVFDKEVFLFFSEDRDIVSTLLRSQLLVFDPRIDRFVVVQRLTTDGAHAAELFISQHKLFLAVANFGDRLGKRYEAQSSLWMWSPQDRNMMLMTSVTSHGATDVEHIHIDGHDYIALSNEGDFGERCQPKHQTSFMYRLTADMCDGFAARVHDEL